MDNKTKVVKIDKIVSTITILTIISILIYFITPNLHAPHNNTFLYIAFFALLLETTLYVIIFVIKLFLILSHKPLPHFLGTPVIFDIIVILTGILFPLVLSL